MQLTTLYFGSSKITYYIENGVCKNR